MSAPASTATNSRPWTCGSASLHRTWCVSGRGGKLHSLAEGSEAKSLHSIQVSPPSSERKIALGSVPAQTTPRPFTCSDRLTVTDWTLECRIPSPAGRQLSPALSLRQRPEPSVPQYTSCGCNGSTVTHPMSLPFKCTSHLACSPSVV